MLFSSNSIFNNTEEANLNTNSINENYRNNNFNNISQVSEALTQEQKLKEDISKAGKLFLEQIKYLIFKKNFVEKENLRNKIIEMIDNAEKYFINTTFIPSELLEEMESIKTKLFFEKQIEEKKFLIDEDLKKDFDEVSRISYSNSDISESTTHLSDDSDDFVFSIDKTKANEKKSKYKSKNLFGLVSTKRNNF